MTTLSTADLSHSAILAVNRVARRRERMIVSRRGRPIAALVPMEDVERLREWERREEEADIRAYRRAKRQYEKGGRVRIPLDRVASELGVDLSR